MLRFRFGRSADDMTMDQRERMQVLAVSTQVDGPERVLAQRRLEYVRNLVESGRIGRDDEAHDDR